MQTKKKPKKITPFWQKHVFSQLSMPSMASIGATWLTHSSPHPRVPTALSETTLKSIIKDVSRTGSRELLLKIDGNSQNVSDFEGKLQECLVKVTERLHGNYNQSLSFICAFALMHLSQDRALVVICELLIGKRIEILMDTSHSLLQQYVDRFEMVFSRVCKDLYDWFEGLGYDTMYFALDWFTTVFTNSLSFEVCEFVWDVVLVWELDDALVLCALAALRCVGKMVVEEKWNLDRLMMDFKRLVKTGITKDEFRGALNQIVSEWVPTTRSTIEEIESKLDDPNEVLVQMPFDATFLMRAVQFADSKRVLLEITKYKFPQDLIDYAMFRAVLLGHAACVDILCDCGQADAMFYAQDDACLGPIDACVLLGQSETLRCLLARCFAKVVFRNHVGNKSEYAQQRALIALKTSMEDVLRIRKECSDDEVWMGVSLVLQKRICWWCGNPGHGTDACPTYGTFIQGVPSSVCAHCEVSLNPAVGGRTPQHRSFPCSRCRRMFCHRCADTFRQLKGRAYRACNSCHHFWGSCACTTTTSCDHDSIDVVSQVACECPACSETFVRLRGRRYLPVKVVEELEFKLNSELDRVTEITRKIKLSGGGDL